MFVTPSLLSLCQKIIFFLFFWNWVDLPPSLLDNVFKYTVFFFWRHPLLVINTRPELACFLTKSFPWATMFAGVLMRYLLTKDFNQMMGLCTKKRVLVTPHHSGELSHHITTDSDVLCGVSLSTSAGQGIISTENGMKKRKTPCWQLLRMWTTDSLYCASLYITIYGGSHRVIRPTIHLIL